MTPVGLGVSPLVQPVLLTLILCSREEEPTLISPASGPEQKPYGAAGAGFCW